MTCQQLFCHQKTKMVFLVAIAFALFLAATIMMIVAHANALEYAKDEVAELKEKSVSCNSEFSYYNDRLWTMGNNESALNVASFSCMGVGQVFLTAGAIAAKHDQNDTTALVSLIALSILIGSLFGLAGGWNSLLPVCGDTCKGPGPIAVMGGVILTLSAIFGGIGYEDYARRHQYSCKKCQRGNYVSAQNNRCNKCGHEKGTSTTEEQRQTSSGKQEDAAADAAKEEAVTDPKEFSSHNYWKEPIRRVSELPELSQTSVDGDTQRSKAPDAEKPAVTPLQTIRRRRLASPTMRRLVEDINRA